MKPIPAHDFADTGRPFSSVLPAPPQRNDSPSNFRRSTGSAQRAYPFLLIASTAIASVFCYMYMTKPVVSIAAETPATAPGSDTPAKTTAPGKDKTSSSAAALLPGKDRLPGDPSIAPLVTPKELPAFEETNLIVQHVVTARVPEGDLSRILLDVPVLYQSRHLRWSQDDVARARQILSQLSDYQEKSVALRSEGTRLLGEWNQLVSRSIPAAELRADSPTLPANQRGTTSSLPPADLNSSETIQLKTPGK